MDLETGTITEVGLTTLIHVNIKAAMTAAHFLETGTSAKLAAET